MGKIPIDCRGGLKKGFVLYLLLIITHHCSVAHKCQNTTGDSGLFLNRPFPIIQIKSVDVSQRVSHDRGSDAGYSVPLLLVLELVAPVM